MPNEDNLLSLTGKKKNRGKKKAQQQQQPAFWVRVNKTTYVKAAKPTKAQIQNRTLLELPQASKSTFQAPHHGAESLVDLTDDKAPVTPLNSAAWKPIDDDSHKTPEKSNLAEIKITPTRQEKLMKYREALNAKKIELKAKLENKITPTRQEKWIKFREALNEKTTELKAHLQDNLDSASTAVATTEAEMAQQGGSTSTSWDLNEGEDKRLSKAGVEIVKGTASEIKLFLHNKEKAVTSVERNVERNVERSVDRSIELEKNSDSNSSKEKTVEEQRNPYKNNDRRTQGRAFGSAPYNKTMDQALPMFYDPRYIQYPKGIPRSFLIQHQAGGNTIQALGAIQPQDQNPGQNPSSAHSKWDQPPERKQLNVQITNTFTNDNPQQYSPTDTYEDGNRMEDEREGSDSPDSQHGQKRLSAFERLGPLSEQPKKPKLTINLLCSKEQSVREVVDETQKEEKEVPVYLRKEVIESKDETVVKYLPFWPWKRDICTRKSVTARNSKSVMILEQEQMEEIYEKDNVFIKVSVKGYPPTWKKEDVLDVLIDALRGKSFIPCFIEFTPEECYFLVSRSRLALLAIHRMGFYIRKDEVELVITITKTVLSTNQLEFIPRLILRKRLASFYDDERKLDLRAFTLGNDISHFIYFPLHLTTNQADLISVQSTVAWNYLTDLNLSHNRLTSIDGFDLHKTTPRLKHLDLSYNCIEKVIVLIRSREVALRSIKLEGNPLCHDFIDPARYVKVVKMIFPALTEIDGVPVHLKGDFPQFKQNYCPTEAIEVANRFLEVFFPLLEVPYDERSRIEDMYDDKAVLTVTCRYGLRYSALYRKFRNLFLRTRSLEEGETEVVEGAVAIAKLISKWPDMQHDRYTFTVDVMHHSESATILRIGGILKLTAETLADDEYLIAFTRTLVLTTLNGIEYKIMNEMIYWDDPSREFSNVAFQMNSMLPKRLSLKIESNPSEELKENLIEIFTQVTGQDKKLSERCLEQKQWNLRSALEYFTKLIKLDDLTTLNTVA